MKDSAFENFSEYAQDALDFARCQRPDGSFYGTSGVCRKGAETGAKEKEAKAAKSASEAAGKTSRKEMIAARDKEKELRAARKTAEAGDDKKAAATARRAHIDSKNEVKAATERFRSGQETGSDNRRFGRDSERSKATDAQLKTALGDKRVSPTAKASIERELSTRQALAKTPSAKAQATSDLKAKRSEVREMDKTAKAADKKADAADKAYQKAAGDARKAEAKATPDMRASRADPGNKALADKFRVSNMEARNARDKAASLKKTAQKEDRAAKAANKAADKADKAFQKSKRDSSKDIKRGGKLVGTSPRNAKIDARRELAQKASAFRKEGRDVPKFLKDALVKIDKDLESGS